MFWKNRFQKNIKANQFLSGLTLVELLVSLAIIAFVTSIFGTNYHTANKRTYLTMSAQVLVADIHRA